MKTKNCKPAGNYIISKGYIGYICQLDKTSSLDAYDIPKKNVLQPNDGSAVKKLKL